MISITSLVPIALIAFVVTIVVAIGLRVDGPSVGLIGATIAGFLAGGLLFGWMAYVMGVRTGEQRHPVSPPQIQWMIVPQAWPPPQPEPLKPVSTSLEQFDTSQPRSFIIGDENS